MREGDKTIDESRQGEALVVDAPTSGKKLYLESYGCAMNFSDSEIIASILSEVGYSTTKDEKEADLILVNTCSIREKAEDRVRNRLNEFKQYKRKNSYHYIKNNVSTKLFWGESRTKKMGIDVIIEPMKRVNKIKKQRIIHV